MLQHYPNTVAEFLSEYHRDKTSDPARNQQRYYAQKYTVNQVRNLLIYIIYLQYLREGRSNYCREMAPLFGVSYSVIARAIRSVSQKMTSVENLYNTTGGYHRTKFTICYYELYVAIHKISRNEAE